MSLDGDKLKAWLKDVIEKNNTKIVLVWDEFSGFFKQNRNSLDEFQKIVALCQEAPFYFIVVTHQTESIINSDDSTWKVVQQRFNFSQISLPDNIAFNLIGHAFNVKPAAQEMWNICADDLNTRLSASRSAVMKAARISDPKVVKDIMPIHPMTALILKNIAVAFQSNQRSMFDFIKIANADDTQAFQWFIEKTGPSDDHPLLTVDMLWDFFYVKGRDNLTADIRMILDTYPQQQNLREDEKRVLKTILIMQAIDKRLGGMIELLKPTEQNISYVYEGITSGLDTQCKNIAKALATKGILVTSPIGNNKYAYGAAVLAGDQAKIDEFKKTIKQNSTTAKLISEGNLDTVLSLPPALKLRYEMTPGCGNLVPVTNADFTRKINELKDAPMDWHFIAVVALAKDDSEAISLRKLVKEAAQNDDYKETNTLLNCNAHSKAEAFEKWREKLEFAMCSHEALEEKFASLKEVYSFLFDIVTRKDILPDQMEKCTQSLCEKRLDVQHYFDNEVGVFYEIYKAYLDDISVEEAAQLKVPQLINVFRKSKTESNALVKQLADEFRKNQTKTKLFNLWKEKTNSKTPRDWSYMHRTPILLMVSKEQYDEAKKAFEVLNRTMATEKEIDNALLLLENAKFYDDLGSEEKINHAFSNLLGRYKGILKDIDKVRDALERLSVETYEWDSHPAVKTKIEELAKAEYDAGGSDAVVSKIENMSSDDLKSHLIKLIKNNMNIGVEIINEGE